MKKPKTPRLPGWMKSTPEVDTYQLNSFNTFDGMSQQIVTLSREEFDFLKQQLWERRTIRLVAEPVGKLTTPPLGPLRTEKLGTLKPWTRKKD